MFSIQEIKKLFKYFLTVFFTATLIVNWNDVSWVFNYKFIARTLTDFFDKISFSARKSDLPTLEILKDIEKSDYRIDDITGVTGDKENIVNIPKIGVEAPLIFPENNTEQGFQRALKKGVMHYPQSALPGKEGATVILGHSAPANWPKINYDRIFNDLYKLEQGDAIYIFFNKRQYIFLVREKTFIQKGKEIPQDFTNFKSGLILLSCWPPGKDEQRIVVSAELVESLAIRNLNF